MLSLGLLPLRLLRVKHSYFLQWCFHAGSSHELSLTHAKSVHSNVPITTEALFHKHHQLQNLFFQASFFFIINYLKITYFFNINNKICSRLRILWTPYLSTFSQAPQFSLQPRQLTGQNQNTTSYSCQNVCVTGFKGEQLSSLKPKLAKWNIYVLQTSRENIRYVTSRRKCINSQHCSKFLVLCIMNWIWKDLVT